MDNPHAALLDGQCSSVIPSPEAYRICGFHLPTVAAFFIQLFGYILFSTALQLGFYHWQRGREEDWKIQLRPRTTEPMGTAGSDCTNTVPQQPHARKQAHQVFEWWLPVASLWRGSGSQRDGNDNRRHPLHTIFCTVNLLMASAFMGSTVEAYLRGWNHLTIPEPGSNGSNASHVWLVSAVEGWPLLRAVAAQLVLEYYWHRLMHWPPCYKVLHKFHHHYKSPRPFDDLFIHPLEAFGYYVILYIVPTCFLGRMPAADFACYMVLHGVCGVLDHCGVNIRLGPLYSVADHDAHHQYFNVNYGFPWLVMDALHGTTFRGRNVRADGR